MISASQSDSESALPTRQGLQRRTAPVSHQKQPDWNATNAIESKQNTEKSPKLLDFPSLITVWLQVRVLPGPPAFAREAYQGCRAEAHLGEGGRGRELRLGKPAFYRLRLGKPSCDHHRENSPKTDALPLPTKISKTTPCKVACCRQDGCVEHSRKNTLTRRAN